MNGCLCSAAYIGTERLCLRAAIASNRTLMHQRTGQAVDERVATADFLDHLLDAFARQFHLNYCRTCPFAGRCHVQV